MNRPPDSRRPFGPPAVWAGLVALLLAEVLALTLRFDAQALVDRGGWSGRLAGGARYLPQALVAVAGAAVVFGLGAVRRQGGRAASEPDADRPGRGAGWRWGFLGLHLASFGALAGLTRAVWEGPLGGSPAALGAWLGAGLLTLLFWALAAQPASAWRTLARRGVESGVLGAAVAVGVGAVLVGGLTRAGAARYWAPLARATLWAVRGLLGLVYRDVVFRPADAVVGTPTFQVEVWPECSGYEGIGLVWAFLGVYLWFFRRSLRFPQALWLLPAGTAVIWVANAARIATLVVIGTAVSPAVALGGFHSQAGWLTFNAVALGLVYASRRARVFARTEGKEAPAETLPASEAGPHPTLAYLGPLLVLVGSLMVTGALSAGGVLDLYYPVRVVAVAAALAAWRRGWSDAGPLWSWSWGAVGLGAVVYALWLALEPLYATPGTAPASPPVDLGGALAGLPRGAALAWLAFRVVGSVVTVPAAEELAFRGYLNRRVLDADFTAVPPGRVTWASALVSSAVFGVLHGRWLAGTLAGLVYALALRRRGRLSDAVLAHATTNALIAAHVLATGAWGLWG